MRIIFLPLFYWVQFEVASFAMKYDLVQPAKAKSKREIVFRSGSSTLFDISENTCEEFEKIHVLNLLIKCHELLL